MTPLLLLSTSALIASAPVPTGKIVEISLERTPCFGTCPGYKLTLKSDGTATYRGERFVDRLGTYRGEFWVGELDRLKPLLDRWGFWSLKDGYRSLATDQLSQIVTVVTDKGRKTIREYGHTGPAELWAVQTLIDGLGASVRGWTKASPQRPS